MRDMMYLIGQPGAGKTTLMRAVFLDTPATVVRTPFPMTLYPGGVELGESRAQFGGTDALRMDIQPVVAEWLYTTPAGNIVAEGDRLSNDRFFVACVLAGWRLSVVYLRCADEIAAQRRGMRGSSQNAAWVKGRTTKVSRLAEKWVSAEWVLDASLPMDDLANILRRHPAVIGCQLGVAP